MENGIILHLLNLDADKCKYSFRTLAKTIHKNEKNEEKKKRLNEASKDYRSAVGYIKNKHRNNRIAYMNYKPDLNFDHFLKFEKVLFPLAQKGFALGDLIWGEKINYKFDLGKFAGESILDFQVLTQDLTIDGRK